MKHSELKALFTLMCNSTDRTTSLGAYKAFRLGIQDATLTRRYISKWMTDAGLVPDDIMEFKESGVYISSLTVFLPDTFALVPPRGITIESNSYSSCLFKLAFKLISYKWDMTLSQIHEVENWSYPVHNRLTSKD